MRHIEDERNVTVAKELNISPGQACSILKKAERAFQELLQQRNIASGLGTSHDHLQNTKRAQDIGNAVRTFENRLSQNDSLEEESINDDVECFLSSLQKSLLTSENPVKNRLMQVESIKHHANNPGILLNTLGL